MSRIVLEVQEIKDSLNSAQKRWNPDLKREQDERLAVLKDECQELNKRGR